MTTQLNYKTDTIGEISSLTIETKSYMQRIDGIMFE